MKGQRMPGELRQNQYATTTMNNRKNMRMKMIKTKKQSMVAVNIKRTLLINV